MFVHEDMVSLDDNSSVIHRYFFLCVHNAAVDSVCVSAYDTIELIREDTQCCISQAFASISLLSQHSHRYTCCMGDVAD